MTGEQSVIEKISATKFKATSLSVLTRVEMTKMTIQVTRYGKPIAEIVPVQSEPKVAKRKLGLFQGKIEILGDIMAPTFDSSDWGHAERLKLLLDTHILIWAASEPTKIGRAAKRRLEDASTELWFSSLSILEILNLQAKGRLGKGDPRWWFPELKKELNLMEAPVTSEIALETSHFTLKTGDLVDNLLVATARVLKLTFFTADRHIVDSGAVPFLENR